jgi:uncharacterized protein YndB with AHSA1/START domain
MIAVDPLRLVVRRVIRAAPERLFAAWTTPEQLLTWWGPQGVRCTRAEIDARIGGRYRLDNSFPDGRIVVIEGEFVSVERPRELVYTWRVDAQNTGAELVTVRFEPRDASTEIVVTHERIGHEAARAGHETGWIGCLDGLAEYLAGRTRTSE